MTIRLTKTIRGYDPRHGCIKGVKFEVLRAEDMGQMGLWVRAKSGQAVKVFPNEYEEVK